MDSQSDLYRYAVMVLILQLLTTERQTRGRQRIPMSLIQNQDDLYATFSKRRVGLYKKASQVSNLCGVDIGIIIFSPTNVPYSFFHPNMDSVVERYRNPNQPRDAYARAVESTARSRIEALNRSLDEVLDEKQQLKEGSREKPIESLNREQVKEQIAWLQAFKAQVEARIEQLQPSTGIEQYEEAHNPSFATGRSDYFLPQDPSAHMCFSPSLFQDAASKSTTNKPN